MEQINTKNEALELLEAIAGRTLAAGEIAACSAVLLPLLKEMDKLNEINTMDIEPLLPPTWKEGRF